MFRLLLILNFAAFTWLGLPARAVPGLLLASDPPTPPEVGEPGSRGQGGGGRIKPGKPEVDSSPTTGIPSLPGSMIQFDPPPPPNLGEPGDRGQGGGRRGNCDFYTGMQALVPIVPQGSQPISWGLTTLAQPTLWFYLPNGITANVPVELTLRDPNGKLLVKHRLNSSAAQPGVISLALSDASAPLQTGTLYSWALAIYCNSESDTPVVVRGAIQRVSLPESVQQAIAQATPLEQAKRYAKHGIWYDALTTLGHQRRLTDNSTLKTAWSELLQQGKLEAPATAPLQPCCGQTQARRP